MAWFTVIRYVPSVVRDEFINVGIILVSPELKRVFVRTRPCYDLPIEKVFPNADVDFLSEQLDRLRYCLSDPSNPDLFGLFGITPSDFGQQDIFSRRLLDCFIGYNKNNIQYSPIGVASGEPTVVLEILYNSLVK